MTPISFLSEKVQVTQMCVTYTFLKKMIMMNIMMMVMLMMDDTKGMGVTHVMVGNDVHEADIQRMMTLVLKLKMMIKKIMLVREVMGMRLMVKGGRQGIMVMVMDESVAKLYCPDPACTSMRMMMMTLMMTVMLLMIMRTTQVTMKMLMMMDDG